MKPYLTSRPVRATLNWQAGATVVLAGLAWFWAGRHGAISAMLGGSITVISGAVYAVVVSLSDSGSAGRTLATMARAEAAKIAAILLLLWVVITRYEELVAAAFFATFVVTVLLNRVAFLVSDAGAAETGGTKRE